MNRWLMKSLLLILSVQSFSYAVVLQNADVVYVKKNCTSIDNCFQTTGELTEWAWGTSTGVNHRIPKPNANSRLLVNIDSGVFGQIKCNNLDLNTKMGFTTFSGTGKGSTFLTEDTKPVTININNCTELKFSHMTIEHTSNAMINKSIVWTGDGNSVWDNVEVINTSRNPNSTNYAWYDLKCDASKEGNTHFWFGSTIKAAARNGTRAYKSNCGETWFYGGLIETYFDSNSLSPVAVVGIETVRGDVRVFGSTLRVYIPPEGILSDISGLSAFVGVSNSGTFHMHGGIISVDASLIAGSFDVVGLISQNGVGAHTPGTAFTVKPPISGKSIRAIGATAKSPFLWPPGSNLPVNQSITGADIFIETDCDAQGYCEGDGLQSHMMIYNDTECVIEKWFDTRVNKCRKTGSNPNM